MKSAAIRFPFPIEPFAALVALLAVLGVGAAAPALPQLDVGRYRYLDQDGNGDPDDGGSEADDQFGWALAAGDRDGDGRAELVIGAPGENTDPEFEEADATSEGAYFIHAGTPDGVGPLTRSDYWVGYFASGLGSAFATGHFDQDALVDLAIGYPSAYINPIDFSAVGRVDILPGAEGGYQTWSQDHAGIQEDAEAGDRFGEALATGDFDCNGFDDLAIGIPREIVAGQVEDPGIPADTGAGAVAVLYAGLDGLSSTGNQFWAQTIAEIPATAEEGDWFGQALAAGDFDGAGCVDLAIGAPGENHGTGIVTVLYGAAAGGLQAAGNQTFLQSDIVTAAGEPGDAFGRSLVSGDFDGDGIDDLAVGAPGLNPFSDTSYYDSGAVYVLYGSGSGLGSAVFLTQGPSAGDEIEGHERFGETLAAGFFDDDPIEDLVIGAPAEWAPTRADVGMIHLLYGTADRFQPFGNRWFTLGRDHPSLAGGYTDSGFGKSLAVGDFDGDGVDDLAVGAPRHRTAADRAWAGAVWIFPGTGSLFSDGFESGGTSSWSTTVP